MIEDTCRCGAKFSVKNHSFMGERMAHDAWLNKHEDCRKRTAPQSTVGELVGTLMELRGRLHAEGLRPETCYELSLIDDAIQLSRTAT